jgi:molybdenum cofactor cytidylyltransferase
MFDKRPTAGIILAAGMSTRLGRPKQLVRFGDRYLIDWVLQASLSSKLARVILVMGYKYATIMKALGKRLQNPRLEIVINQKYREGMGSSLRLGLERARADFPSVMFLLGDQPIVDSPTIDWLLEKFWESEKDICVPVHKGVRGNPTLFSKAVYDKLLTIKGDMGAREIIQVNSKRVLFVELANPNLFLDIDTLEDVQTFSSHLPES